MRIKIRLKGTQDIDLLALKMNPAFYFERAMKLAVIQHIRGGDVPIYTPHPYAGEIPNIQNVYISFNDKEEADIIAWYKAIKEGYRSTALKAILRCALSRAYVDVLTGEIDVAMLSPVKPAPKTTSPKEEVKKKEEVKEVEVMLPKEREASSSKEGFTPAEDKGDAPSESEEAFSLDDFVEVY